MFWKQILLGLFIGATFGWWFKRTLHRDNRPVRGPSSRKVMSTVYYDKITDQHYRFNPITHVCPPSLDVDALEHSDDVDSIE